jgi:hypothetical protein
MPVELTKYAIKSKNRFQTLFSLVILESSAEISVKGFTSTAPFFMRLVNEELYLIALQHQGKPNY